MRDAKVRFLSLLSVITDHNNTVGQAIWSYLDEHKNWDTELSRIQFTINTAVHEVHGFTPTYLVF